MRDPHEETTIYAEQKNIKVKDLIPGMTVSVPFTDMTAVFVGQLPHPIWTKMQMVIWREGNFHTKRGKWFHDALSPEQVVGNTWKMTEEQREKNLRWALLNY